MNEKIKLDEARDKDILKGWFQHAEKIRTPEEAAEFMSILINNYEHDYGTIVHAAAAAMMGAFSAMNESEQGGITGFQTGFLVALLADRLAMMDYPIIRDGANWLYPQYEEQCTTITAEFFGWLQAEAAKMLEDNKGRAAKRVRDHWQRIAAGEPPFGVKVRSK